MFLWEEAGGLLDQTIMNHKTKGPPTLTAKVVLIF